MSTVDTSTAAVDLMARRIACEDFDCSDEDEYDAIDLAPATLRALAAERDALKAALTEALEWLSDEAQASDSDLTYESKQDLRATVARLEALLK